LLLITSISIDNPAVQPLDSLKRYSMQSTPWVLGSEVIFMPHQEGEAVRIKSVPAFPQIQEILIDFQKS